MRLRLLPVFMIPLMGLADNTLTDRQADIIVANEMEAKEAKRLAETPDFQVLQRRVVELNNGGTLVMDEVAKPQLKKREKIEPVQLSSEQIELLGDIEEGKHKFLSLNVWVYDNKVSHIRWSDPDGRQYSAWTEADMNLCRVIRGFSAGDITYTLGALVLNESIENLRERQKLAKREGVDLKIPEIPDLPESSNGVTEYFVETNDPTLLENEEVFSGLDALMVYLDQNKKELQQALHDQRKISEAKKRYHQQNQQPQQTTFIHWVPEQ